MGIDAAGESEITSGPGFFRSIAMLNWPEAEPNARYRVLKLISDNFGPGDTLVDSPGGVPNVMIQGFIKPDGTRKLLLVNRRDRAVEMTLAETTGASLEMIDQITGSNPPAVTTIQDDRIRLNGLGVAVLTEAR
jgi:hypothetical protein